MPVAVEAVCSQATRSLWWTGFWQEYFERARWVADAALTVVCRRALPRKVNGESPHLFAADPHMISGTDILQCAPLKEGRFLAAEKRASFPRRFDLTAPTFKIAQGGMELTSDRTVEELLASVGHTRGKRGVADGPTAPSEANRPYKRRHSTSSPGVSPRQQRRCSCGTCAVCLDNAKWERVFNEKFADPNYYKASSTRSGSSLSWLG